MFWILTFISYEHIEYTKLVLFDLDTANVIILFGQLDKIALLLK